MEQGYGRQFTHETSLDRLYFRPTDDPEAAPKPTLAVATLADRRGEIEARLKGMDKKSLEGCQDSGNSRYGRIRPGRRALLGCYASSWRLILPSMEFVSIAASLMRRNVFILSGLQDHEKQADGMLALVDPAAAVAWPNLPAPSSSRTGKFVTFSFAASP